MDKNEHVLPVNLTGTVIAGTMNTGDVGTAIQDFLKEHMPAVYARVENALEHNLEGSTFAIIAAQYNPLEMSADDPWWNCDDQDGNWYVWEYLWDLMEEISPPGCYFGAHEDDGSDYGFWPMESDL